MKRLAFAIVTSLFALSNATAQTYPTKPIRMVVGFVAGGPTDAIAGDATTTETLAAGATHGCRLIEP